MNKISTIKPSGKVERTKAPFNPLTVNNVLWSDTIITWSDILEKWSALQYNNNALSPQIIIEKIKVFAYQSKGISPNIYLSNIKPKIDGEYQRYLTTRPVTTLYEGMPMGLLLALTYPTTINL